MNEIKAKEARMKAGLYKEEIKEELKRIYKSIEEAAELGDVSIIEKGKRYRPFGLEEDWHPFLKHIVWNLRRNGYKCTSYYNDFRGADDIGLKISWETE